jgi:2-deoxy-D-gluconate 3-dehydrogenase
MSGLFDLSGRVALVTGAARGLGRAMAAGLARHGADIAGVSRTGDDGGLAAEVRAAGRRYLDLRADLADPAARKGLADRVAAGLGRLDILLNNAGIQFRSPSAEFPLPEWNRLLEVHVTAAFDLSQQAAAHMLPRGSGRIINIGSVLSFQGGLNIPAYTAAKHAVAGLTQALANEWAGRGVNVNGIAPGYMETEMSLALKADPVRGPAILGRIPAGRWGRPDELVGAAVYLASDASSYVHGHMLVVDGGWLGR